MGYLDGMTLTKMTGEGEVRLTYQYMAPEQKKNFKNSSPESDIFSLGLIFYEIYTGNHLCQEDLDSIESSIQNKEMKNYEISKAIEKTLAKRIKLSPRDFRNEIPENINEIIM